MTFQKGDYVATEGLSDDEYEAIACAMRDAGATKGEHVARESCLPLTAEPAGWDLFRYVGWDTYNNNIYHANDSTVFSRCIPKDQALEMTKAPPRPKWKDPMIELRDASVELDHANVRYKAALQRVTDLLPVGHAILVE